MQIGAVSKAGLIYAYNTHALDHTIYTIDTHGNVASIIGGPDFHPGRMVLDAKEENLYVVGGVSNIFSVLINGIPALKGSFANVIYRVKLIDNSITMIAGKYVVDDIKGGFIDGIGFSAEFNILGPVILSNDSNYLYLTDMGNGLIRRLELSTYIVDTLAGKLLPQPFNSMALFKPGKYTTSEFIPMGIVQNSNGDIIFSASCRTTDNELTSAPLCVITR
jgi:hypothetical protein